MSNGLIIFGFHIHHIFPSELFTGENGDAFRKAPARRTVMPSFGGRRRVLQKRSFVVPSI